MTLDLEALEALTKYGAWLDCHVDTVAAALPHLLAIAKAAYAWADSDEVDMVLPKRCEGDLLEAIEAARKGTP